MDLLQTIILALIQGLTEFLPISSSAHLILPSQVLGWPDQGLAFDVAVHLGSLAAVVVYFRQDLQKLVSAFFSTLAKPRNIANNNDAILAWQVGVATMPAVLVALLASDFIEQHLRSAAVIAATTIIFGLILALAEWRIRNSSAICELTWSIAIFIGLAQVFALIPGTSRSGVTIAAGVLLGISRTDAARFSFLLSIPIILAAGGYLILQLVMESPVFSWSQLIIAMLVSGVSAWACIAVFLRLIEKIGLMPFVWYRLLLGAGLIVLIAQHRI